jgi:hypothetical protein
VILGVEMPGRQGVKSQEYMDIPRFCNAAGRDASASKMVIYYRASPKSFKHHSYVLTSRDRQNLW